MSLLPHLPNIITSEVEGSYSDDAKTLRALAHKTARAVAEDIEAFHMNKAVARIREFSNAIQGFLSKTIIIKTDSHSEQSEESLSDKAVLRESLEYLVQILNPMVPHLTEQLWEDLGHKTPLTQTPWPSTDESLLTEDTVTIGVQVNGKVRATITLPADADKKQTEEIALAEPNVQKNIDGKTIRKVIVVPGRIVNIVAN